jgi:hypothetical protein
MSGSVGFDISDGLMYLRNNIYHGAWFLSAENIHVWERLNNKHSNHIPKVFKIYMNHDNEGQSQQGSHQQARAAAGSSDPVKSQAAATGTSA